MNVAAFETSGQRSIIQRLEAYEQALQELQVSGCPIGSCAFGDCPTRDGCSSLHDAQGIVLRQYTLLDQRMNQALKKK